jgi:L-ornithine Nalpha-acyltransferase
MQMPFAAYFSAQAVLRAGHSLPANLPKLKRIIRDLCGLPPTLARAGSLELRLATTKKEIRKAQRLRYKVFFEEGSAIPDRTAKLLRRDICAYDRVCDHLLVIDHAARSRRLGILKPKVIGVYRLLRGDVAKRGPGFYSAQEFDIAPLLARHDGKRFLELGRACVLANYRGKGVIELLWQGIGAYVRHHDIDVLIGCASLEGCDVEKLAPQLAALARVRPDAGREWSARAHDSRRVAMDSAAVTPAQMARAQRALPPLVKAYLRCGAYVGDGAVVDARFGATDVLVVLPVAQIAPRYLAQFGGAARQALAPEIRANA